MLLLNCREEEPEDDVKVHVEWAPNDYHDDHFDLDGNRDLLLGKTLCKLAASNPTGNEEIDKALMILGLTLFEKV